MDQRSSVTSNSWIADCTADKGQSKLLYVHVLFLLELCLDSRHTTVVCRESYHLSPNNVNNCERNFHLLQVNVFTQYPDINLQLQAQKEDC